MKNLGRLVFTVQETSELLGLSTITIYRRLADGSIPSVLIGRRRLVPAAFFQKIEAGEVPANA
jgi:excisionase family DNA binding protein